MRNIRQNVRSRVIRPPRTPRSVAGAIVALWAAGSIGSLALGASSAAAAASQSAHVNEATSGTTTATDEQEAAASYQALQANLYESSAQLYQGLPSSSCDPYSCLWPFTNAMAGTEYLAASPGGSSYASAVTARVSGLLSYADLREISPAGASQPRAFESAVAKPKGPGGNTYYDDNAWSALDLLDGYELTANSTDLTLAQDTFNFIVSGWDTSQTDGCPGGVFWEDVSGSERNTTANAAGAEVGLELYQLTKDSSDLAWATKMYQWVNACLTSSTSSGLYDDHVNPGGSVNTTIWSYNQGAMIGAGVILYQITGTPSYLTAAENTAEAAVAYFGTGTTLQSQGPAFNAIYFRDLFVLGQVQPNSAYSTEAQAYATYMWTQTRLERTVPPKRRDQRREWNGPDGRDLRPTRREYGPAVGTSADPSGLRSVQSAYIDGMGAMKDAAARAHKGNDGAPHLCLGVRHHHHRLRVGGG